MSPLRKKEIAEMTWAIFALGLGLLFSFTQLVPDLGSLVSTQAKLAFGLTAGFCAGSTFFLMGLPVIDVVSDVLRKKKDNQQ